MTGKELGQQPAYPYGLEKNKHTVHDYLGQTKREAFAASVMQGLLADPQVLRAGTEGIVRAYAVVAVDYADALLDELAKEA